LVGSLDRALRDGPQQLPPGAPDPLVNATRIADQVAGYIPVFAAG